MTNGKVIGIDFGTTNSCMAVVKQGKPVIIPNTEGQRLTPSVVALNPDGQWLVGIQAKRQAFANSSSTIFSVKRLMGRKFEEVRPAQQWLPYEVVRAVNGDANIRIDGLDYSPPRIAAMIIRKMKRDAEAFLGEEVDGAVITVPNYFNYFQRRAIGEAVKLAGLDYGGRLLITNESDAACLAYGFRSNVDETIAIVNFGGGSFDVSIHELGDGVFETKAIAGAANLGGDDIDRKIVWLVLQCIKKHQSDYVCDMTTLQHLREIAEKTKCTLSNAGSEEIDLRFTGSNNSRSKRIKLQLSRRKLEDLAAPYLACLSDSIKGALDDAFIDSTEIDRVLLAGGMSRMPNVQETIADLFGKSPLKKANPDEVVAIGAAIRGGAISGELPDVLLLSATAFSYGVTTGDGEIIVIIHDNTTIPTKNSVTFSTTRDDQTKVVISVVEFDSRNKTEYITLGKLHLTIPPAPKGVPQIEVTFDLDTIGVLKITAKDLGTGEKKVMVQ